MAVADPVITVLETRSVPLKDLSPYPANPRNGDIDLIRESVRAHGQYRAMVVNRRSMQVLAGNHLLHAMLAEGFTEGLCHFVDVDDEEAARIVLVDNRASDLGKYDDGLLAQLLESLPDLSGTGYDDRALQDLLGSLGPKEGLTDPDEVPGLPKEAVTKPGDLWILGDHRLLCGDATKAEDYERVLGGKAPRLLWTDPPYGVAYVGKTEERLEIANDDASGLEGLLASALGLCGSALEPGSPFYLAHPAGALGVVFHEAVIRLGWRYHEDLVWAKDVFVLGHSDYHIQHEGIIYGWLPGEGRSGRGHHKGTRWFGDNAQASVLSYARPKRSAEHPTMKPIELVAQCVGNSSRVGDAVLDPFAGSGSTLIASHQLGRVAYLTEIDPLYCDVICRRFQEFSGIVPKRESGEEVSFIPELE